MMPTLKQMMPDLPDMDIAVLIKGAVIAVLTFAIIFYTSYIWVYRLIKRFTLKNVLYIALITIALTSLRLLPQFVPELQTANTEYNQEHLTISPLLNFLILLIFTVFQMGVALGFKAIIAYFDEKKKRKELETSNLKNELGMLRSQVNPHFLFNTLNNIDMLIKKSPQQASDLIIKLSDEMRYMLYESNIDLIKIEKEREFLENYISLQKIRIYHKNPITCIFDIDKPEAKIPPMLFLPLVENAFKHGRFDNEQEQIRLKLKLDNNLLKFSISNAYDKDSTISTRHSGLGLELVKKRFELLFPGKTDFSIDKSNSIFTVKFSIQLDED